MRQNKYAKWHACKRCDLRPSYLAKGPYQGETRAVGPTASSWRYVDVVWFTVVKLAEQL